MFADQVILRQQWDTLALSFEVRFDTTVWLQQALLASFTASFSAYPAPARPAPVRFGTLSRSVRRRCGRQRIRSATRAASGWPPSKARLHSSSITVACPVLHMEISRTHAGTGTRGQRSTQRGAAALPQRLTFSTFAHDQSAQNKRRSSARRSFGSPRMSARRWRGRSRRRRA